jgi:hypothetical protein
MMIRSQVPRAVALCALAIVITLFLHLPFIIYPSSFLLRYHSYNLGSQPEHSNLSNITTPFNSLPRLSPSSKSLHHRATTDDVYQKSITKGWGLHCLMDATLSSAATMVQNSPKWKTLKMESEFIDPLMAPLEWGWDVQTLDLKDSLTILADYRIDKMLEFLGVNTELKSWTGGLVSHERAWEAEDGRSGPVSHPSSPD